MEEPPRLDEKVITKVGESTLCDTDPCQKSPRAMTDHQRRIRPDWDRKHRLESFLEERG